MQHCSSARHPMNRSLLKCPSPRNELVPAGLNPYRPYYSFKGCARYQGTITGNTNNHRQLGSVGLTRISMSQVINQCRRESHDYHAKKYSVYHYHIALRDQREHAGFLRQSRLAGASITPTAAHHTALRRTPTLSCVDNPPVCMY